MPSLIRQLYAFGPFRLDPANRLLLRDGKPVSLGAKTYETLLVLIRNQGKVLSKDELLEAVWPDTVVEEANLAVNISSLRKALGESPSEHKYIVTIPGRGYQFVAKVMEWGDDEPLVVEKYTVTEAVIEDVLERSRNPRPGSCSGVMGRFELAAFVWVYRPNTLRRSFAIQTVKV
jgi:DNA-binding winged helix-turn-helix (wHTH) protein